MGLPSHRHWIELIGGDDRQDDVRWMSLTVQHGLVRGPHQYAEHMVRNVAQLWRDGSHPIKMKLQTLVLPEGLDYEDGRFGNAKVGLFYGGIPVLSEDDSRLVTH